MKRLTRLLIAAALTLTAMVSVPKDVAAVDWCWDCLVIPYPDNCYACCRCDHYTHSQCVNMMCP